MVDMVAQRYHDRWENFVFPLNTLLFTVKSMRICRPH